MIFSYPVWDSELVGRVGLPSSPLRLMCRRILLPIFPGRSTRVAAFGVPASTAPGRRRRERSVVLEAYFMVATEDARILRIAFGFVSRCLVQLDVVRCCPPIG